MLEATHVPLCFDGGQLRHGRLEVEAGRDSIVFGIEIHDAAHHQHQQIHVGVLVILELLLNLHVERGAEEPAVQLPLVFLHSVAAGFGRAKEAEGSVDLVGVPFHVHFAVSILEVDMGTLRPVVERAAAANAQPPDNGGGLVCAK